MVGGHSQLMAMVRLLGAAPATERPRLIVDIARTFPQPDIRKIDSDIAPEANESADPGMQFMRRHLGAGYRLFTVEGDRNGGEIGISLPDGAMLSMKKPPDRHPGPFWGGPWMITLLFAVVSLTLLGTHAQRPKAAWADRAHCIAGAASTRVVAVVHAFAATYLHVDRGPAAESGPAFIIPPRKGIMIEGFSWLVAIFALTPHR